MIEREVCSLLCAIVIYHSGISQTETFSIATVAEAAVHLNRIICSEKRWNPNQSGLDSSGSLSTVLKGTGHLNKLEMDMICVP